MIKSSRFILQVNTSFQRKLLVLSDILPRNSLYSKFKDNKQIYANLQRKSVTKHVCQCRQLYLSSNLYKKRKTREEKKQKVDRSLPESNYKRKRVVQIWLNMTVKELADSLGMSLDELLELMTFVPNTEKYKKPNSPIDSFATLQLIIKQLDCRWVLMPQNKPETKVSKDATKQPPAKPEDLVPRWPVVTVMGHVDHGKTTLLDKLRNTSVVQKEFGGITQHIGAFLVKLNDKTITFLDTPGHAAFSTMRMRGASVTDIVVLVVAADDGVMEQTDESIKMAKQARVPIVVAINKIDKPQADIERTKNMLMERGIELEDAGGDVQTVAISALKGKNLDQLIEAILVQAEMMQLKADPNGLCEGAVIESKNDTHRGKVATVLVQRGTLSVGKVLVAGQAWCKVRTMVDERNRRMSAATPATPVEITGWRDLLPSAGDIVLQVQNEKRAREVIDWRKAHVLAEKGEKDHEEIIKKLEDHQMAHTQKMQERRSAGYRYYRRTGPRPRQYDEDESIKLSIIIKGDVDGSVEAIFNVLMTYNSNMCKLDVVHFEVGQVSVSDVQLAESFNAIIYAFNVGVLDDAKSLAAEKNVRIHSENVIYRLIDDIKSEIDKILPLVDVETVIGEAAVLQQFIVTEGKKKIPVAGCRCVKGELKKSALFKVVRKDETIYEGELNSMRHMKDEVDKIKTNSECGLRFANTSILVEAGDTIICFQKEKKPQTTDWNPGF